MSDEMTWQERAAANVAADSWLPHRKPSRHGEGPWDVVVARYALGEGRYAEAEHPRNRLGKWIDVLGGNLDKATTLGVTPFLSDPTETRGRAFRDLAPGEPIKDFAHAAALHADKHWEPLFKAFEADAEKLAKQHGVQIVRGERNVGVFEGNYEPSYAISVTGPKAKIDAYNKALGAKYRQKAVVGFTADKKGRDVEVRFSGGKDPDAFFGDLVSVMGDDAGASYDADAWRVFVYDGAEGGHEQVAKLAALAKRRGMTAKVFRGSGDYFQLREGKG